MTVAIKRSNGDLFWFDAVLSFSRQLSGSVSKHPLEDGSVITDHTTIDNEVISLSGVLSDADFNLHRPIIDQAQADLYNVSNKQFINSTPVTQSSTGNVLESSLYNNIVITDVEEVSRFFPESIGQFFGTSVPTVTLNPRTPPQKAMPALAVQGYMIAMFNAQEGFELLNFIDGRIDEVFTNCVMTSLSFAEDPDSGDAIYPVMTVERVQYATSTSVKITKRVSKDVEKKAATQQNKGKQNPTTGTSDDPSLSTHSHTKNAEKSVLREGTTRGGSQ